MEPRITQKTGIPAATAIPKNNYAPKSFDSNSTKYQVEGYSYPSDLMGNTKEYGSNYVIFYINVNNDSKMLKNPNADQMTVDIGSSERIKKLITEKEYSTETVIATQIASGAVLGAGAGGVIGSAIADKIGGGFIAGAAVGGVISGVGAAGIAVNSSGFSRAQKRLKTAIALHVPNQLSIRYGAGWSEEETFGMQAIIEGAKDTAKALSEAGKALVSKEGAGGAIRALGTGAKGVSGIVANLALSKGPNAGAMSAMSGLAPNPLKEQIFKGVDFRTFSVDYSFAPRSAFEAKSVLNIIQAFKYHMHPEYKDANNFLYLYPSEFDVVYYHNGVENMNIHRHTSCVLTEMNINYTPNSNFTTFENGIPTQINVTMAFRELTILTKELIAQGL